MDQRRPVLSQPGYQIHDSVGGHLVGDIVSQIDRHGVGPISLEGHTGWVQSLAFSPDGNTLVSGSADRTVRTWRINAAELADIICKTVTRKLTPDEWEKFVGHDIPFSDYEPCPQSTQ